MDTRLLHIALIIILRRFGLRPKPCSANIHEVIVSKTQSRALNYRDGGDGVAQLVERRTQESMTRGSNPVRSTTHRNCESFSESKMLC